MNYNDEQRLDFEKIVLNIFHKEAKIIKNVIFQKDFLSSNKIQKELKILDNSTTVEEIIVTLTNICNILSDLKNFDLAIIFQQFSQRYIYFGGTINDFNTYFQSIDKEVIFQNSKSNFLVIYTTFFNGQINYYTQKYLNLINTSDITIWSAEINAILNEFCNNIIQGENIIDKLYYAEGLQGYLNNYDNFFIKLNLEEAATDKENFLNDTMEFKVVLQSLSILIEIVIDEINNIIKGE